MYYIWSCIVPFLLNNITAFSVIKGTSILPISLFKFCTIVLDCILLCYFTKFRSTFFIVIGQQVRFNKNCWCSIILLPLSFIFQRFFNITCNFFHFLTMHNFTVNQLWQTHLSVRSSSCMLLSSWSGSEYCSTFYYAAYF